MTVSQDRLACAAVVAALILTMLIVCHGCALPGRQAERPPEGAPAESVAVPVTRVPIDRPELPLPEYPETFAVANPAPEDTPETLATKQDLARLVASIETLKAETAASIYKQAQAAKQEAAGAQKTRDVELAALEEELRVKAKALADSARADTYDANKWLWAILAAAIAAVAYAYKRLSLAAAALALIGFAFLFALVLAGKHYPRLVALSPVPFILLLTYAAWKNGIVTQALHACVRGVEMADDERTKAAIKEQPGADKIEVARAEIDKATVKRDKKAHARARAKREAAEAAD